MSEHDATAISDGDYVSPLPRANVRMKLLPVSEYEAALAAARAEGRREVLDVVREHGKRYRQYRKAAHARADVYEQQNMPAFRHHAERMARDAEKELNACIAILRAFGETA